MKERTIQRIAYWVMYMATGLSLIMAFNMVVYVLAFREIPEANRELFIHAMGMIEGGFIGAIVGTFFGSSKRDHEPGTTIETETYTKNP